MLNIPHKFQSGYELFATLCIVGDSDLASIYEYLTSIRGSYCKNESIVIVISGNWEYETGLLRCWLNEQQSTGITEGVVFNAFLFLARRQRLTLGLERRMFPMSHSMYTYFKKVDLVQ